MDWYWNTLRDLAWLALFAVPLFAAIAAIGWCGLQFHRGIRRGRKGWRSQAIGIAYLCGIASLLLFAPELWEAFLVLLTLFVLGFFGIFFVPGEWDEADLLRD